MNDKSNLAVGNIHLLGQIAAAALYCVTLGC